MAACHCVSFSGQDRRDAHVSTSTEEKRENAHDNDVEG